MTNEDLKNILTTLINEKDTVYDFLNNQNPDDVMNGILKIPTTLLKTKLTEFIDEKKLLPSEIVNLDFDFFNDAFVIDTCIVPSKLIGKIDIFLSLRILSLKFYNGNIKAAFKFTEKSENRGMKTFLINSLSKNRSLLAIALEKMDLPPFTKAAVDGDILKLYIKYDKLAPLSDLNLEFEKLTNEFAFFKYFVTDEVTKSGNNSNNPKPTKTQNITAKSGYLRNILNYSDRF